MFQVPQPIGVSFAPIRAADTTVSASMSKGSRNVATTSPSSQVQFDSTKLSRRRFSRGVCLANNLCAFRARSRSATPSSSVGLIGVLMALNFSLAAILLFPPLVRHFLKESRVHQPVEFVDIHCVYSILKSLVFGLVALDRFLMLLPLVGVARVERISDPFENLVVELQAAEQFGELRFERFLADVFAAAGCRIAPALI